MANKSLHIEVIYALPDIQTRRYLNVPLNSTLEAAIYASGILEQHTEIDLSKNKIGIFGKIKPLNTTLIADTRIEIYRPLLIDPKTARRQKAAKKPLSRRHT